MKWWQLILILVVIGVGYFWFTAWAFGVAFGASVPRKTDAE
jgi:hypothetical protein